MNQENNAVEQATEIPFEEMTQDQKIEAMEKLFLRKVLVLGRPALKLECQEVKEEEFGTEQLAASIQSLTITMLYEGGYGLSANQIGVDRRIFVIKSEGPLKPKVFINPVIKEASDETIAIREGCLSVPNIESPVVRSKKLTLQYNDFDGGQLETTLEDLNAVCAQHEIDHLNGILFYERLSKFSKQRMIDKLKKKAKKDKGLDSLLETLR